MNIVRLAFRILVSPVVFALSAIPLVVFPSLMGPVFGIGMVVYALLVPERTLFPETRKSKVLGGLALATAFILVPIGMTCAWIKDGDLLKFE